MRTRPAPAGLHLVGEDSSVLEKATGEYHKTVGWIFVGLDLQCSEKRALKPKGSRAKALFLVSSYSAFY